jgi:predicted enzyme related to lactoylglutathione lyase
MSETQGRYSWHELMTNDVAAAGKFYSELVGWVAAPWKDGDMANAYTFFMSGDRPAAGMMPMMESATAMGAGPRWLAYVAVDDIDDTVAKTTALGGAVLVPIQDVATVGRFAVLRDPQGAVFGAITGVNKLAPEEDPRPQEFSWHELVTTDLAGAVSFYESIFGWKKQSEFDMGDMGKYHMYGRDRFTYGGMMTMVPGQPGPFWLNYVQVSDTADAAAERAKAAGAKVFLGPMEVPGGDRVAAMTDPQGAAVAVHSKAGK